MHEFFYNARNAYWSLKVEARHEAAGTHQVSDLLHLWMTPAAVEGFDPGDFWFLPEDERRSLESAVVSFRDSASRAAPSSKASDDQVQAARPALQAIANILRLDDYTEAEQYRTAMILANCRSLLQASVEPRIVELVHEFEQDSESEALTVWVVLEDSVTDSDDFFGTADCIREKLQEMLQVYGVPYWPYIRFRSRTEQQELVEAHGS